MKLIIISCIFFTLGQTALAQSKWEVVPFVVGKPFELLDKKMFDSSPVKCQQLNHPELPICEQIKNSKFKNIVLNLDMPQGSTQGVDIVLWSRFHQNKFRLVPLDIYHAPNKIEAQGLNLSLEKNYYKCSMVDNEVEKNVINTHWTLKGRFFEKRITSKDTILQNPYAQEVVCHKILFNGYLFSKVSKKFVVKSPEIKESLKPIYLKPLPFLSKGLDEQLENKQSFSKHLQLSQNQSAFFFIPFNALEGLDWQCEPKNIKLKCKVVHVNKGKGFLFSVKVTDDSFQSGVITLKPVLKSFLNGPRNGGSQDFNLSLSQKVNFQASFPAAAKLVEQEEQYACLPQENRKGTLYQTLWRLGNSEKLILSHSLSKKIANQYKKITCFVIYQVKTHFKVESQKFSPGFTHVSLQNMENPFLLTTNKYTVDVKGKFQKTVKAKCILSSENNRFLALDKNICRVEKINSKGIQIAIQLSKEDLKKVYSYPFGSYELFLPKKLSLHIGIEDDNQALSWQVSAQILIPNSRPNVLMQRRERDCEVRVQDTDGNHISGFLKNQVNSFAFATFATQTQPKVRLKQYSESTIFFFPHDGVGCEFVASDGILYTRDNLNLEGSTDAELLGAPSVFSLRAYYTGDLFQKAYQYRVKFHSGRNVYKDGNIYLNPLFLGFVNEPIKILNPYLSRSLLGSLDLNVDLSYGFFETYQRRFWLENLFTGQGL